MPPSLCACLPGAWRCQHNNNINNNITKLIAKPLIAIVINSKTIDVINVVINVNNTIVIINISPTINTIIIIIIILSSFLLSVVLLLLLVVVVVLLLSPDTSI